MTVGRIQFGSSTPAPWEWDGKFTVAIPHAKGMTAFRTNPEDARLIAAAPDLLAALRALLGVLEADDLTESVSNYMRQARAAIAKAEGR